MSSFVKRVTSVPLKDAAVLIALNVVPLIGVALWDWRSFDLIFIYWVENVLIGLVTAVRMFMFILSSGAGQFFLVPFFLAHYGMFCFVHGTFVVALFGGGRGLSDLGPAVVTVLSEPLMLIAVFSLLLLQVYDMWRSAQDESGQAGGEQTESRAQLSPEKQVQQLMMAPYRRIVVLHITIIASGFLLSALGEPIGGLVLLIVVKTVSDLYHFNNEPSAQNFDDLFKQY